MTNAQRSPVVFMPDNEPYLGLESVLWFDRVIVWALEGNQQVASYTHAHQNELSPLQKAASQIIPQGINIALSIREMVRQGYLFPALVLMRPLIERAAVLSYLIANPPAVALWESGWKHAHRPSLARMLQSMSGTNIDPKTAQAVCDTHNHIVHADPVGTYHNLVDLSDGRVGYASSKMLDSPEMANRISMEAQCYLVVLGGRMAQVFPEAGAPAAPISRSAAE